MKYRHHMAALAYALVTFLTRLKYLKLAFYQGHVYFVDADCFTRMFRVRRLLEEHLFFQSFHPFENFPDGIHTHTTSLFDWIIGGLALALSVVTPDFLDWSGLLVSPLLAAGTAFFVYHLSAKWELGWARYLFLGGVLLSPSLIWSGSVGRPDHQGIMIDLILLAWMLEPLRKGKHRYRVAAAICWGMALWVSLWEPLILFLFLVIYRLLVFKREDLSFLGIALGTAVLAHALNGFSLDAITTLRGAYAVHWLSGIAEVQPLDWQWLIQLGLPALFLPVAAWVFHRYRWWKNDRILFSAAITMFLLLLFLWQRRWSPFLSAASLLLLAAACAGQQRRLWRSGILLLHFLPVCWWTAKEMGGISSPLELAALKEVCRKIDSPGAVLAPWWLSPAILYYSGHPIIASSSHQSLPGIVDSARVFSTDSFPEAEEILRRRQVSWILLSRPDHVYQDAFRILTGRVPRSKDLPNSPTTTLFLMRLWRSLALPSFYHLKHFTGDFALYRVDFSEGQEK